MPDLPKTIATLSSIAELYDVFLIDQFGTIHDGQHPYHGALECLRWLRASGKRVAILSNSGKRADPNMGRLDAMGIPRDCYDLFVSSGEIGHRQLAACSSARRCYLIARGGDRAILDGLAVSLADRPEDAELILITGSDAEIIPLSTYETLLRPAAERGIPALCLNPDMTMLTPLGHAPGAGQISSRYEAMGGTVEWVGKPYPAIYRHTLAHLGVAAAASAIGIGDSVAHDVAGAKRAGCAAAVVLTGIASGLGEADLARECRDASAWPDHVIRRFSV